VALRREWHGSARSLNGRAALFFMVGSSLFALGSFPPYARWVDPRVDAMTFVVGAVFFTTAGFHQLLEASEPGTRHRFGFRFRSIVWWACAVQSLGTLFFNANTIRALDTTLSPSEVDKLVWQPDLLGSICFLIASELAWWDACGGWWAVRRGDTDWWIAAINYLGSIAFMASALAAFVLPTTGEVLNIAVVNVGTFAGALCFFAGAYLLLPPLAGEARVADAARG
jgi:hypothetical protein